MSVLRDERGCLTAEGLAAVRAVPAGQVASDLATHLAGCSRCQERLLAGGAAALATRRKKEPPPAWRLIAIVVFVLLAILSILVTAQRVTAP